MGGRKAPTPPPPVDGTAEQRRARSCFRPGCALFGLSLMSEYSAVRGGQLKLKGKAGSQFKKKKSKRKRGDSASERTGALGELKHGESPPS